MPRHTRRRFLQQSASLGVAFWVGNSAAPAWSNSPNEKVNIACIGVGGKGSSDTDQASQFGNIVALCDIDDTRLNGKAEAHPQAKKYNDFRKLLEEMGPKVDAVTVSTPDHTHAPAAVMAMRLGKHVYCQKPLTHSVYEARLMRELAAEKKLATQMGNQGTADDGFRGAVEVVRAGAIGPVREVHVWTNRPVWPQAPDMVDRPKEKPECPATVHWDLFLGPAPERPYHPCYHPFKWRGWWDYGTGALGDMACHTANMAFMALNLGYPTSIEAQAGDVNPETFPAWATIQWEFPARGEQPPVKFFWYEGKRDGKKNLPPAELSQGNTFTDSGLLLVGDKGTLFSPNDYGAAYVLLPAKNFEGFKPPEPSLPRHGGGEKDANMKKEWVAAIKGGPAPLSNFGYAGLFTEAMLLGNVAIRAGKKLVYDGQSMAFPNAPEAEQWLHREYRSGWKL